MIIDEKTDRAIRKSVADANARFAEDCLVVGQIYRHPKSKRLLRVTSGQFFGGYGRISNHWRWEYLDAPPGKASQKDSGYGWAAKPIEE